MPNAIASEGARLGQEGPQTATSSDEARAIPTRTRILEAMEEILSEGRHPRSVRDVLHRSGISRSGFYSHFKSLDAVYEELLYELTERHGRRVVQMRIAGSPADVVVRRQTMAAFLTFMDQSRTLYRHLVGREGRAGARARFRDRLTVMARQSLLSSASTPRDTNIEMVAAFMGGGFLEVVGIWLEDGDPCSPDELADALIRLGPPWLTAVPSRA